VHQQVLIAPIGIKDIIPVYTQHNFYPATFWMRLSNNSLIQCHSLGKMYAQHVTTAEIMKLPGVPEKLPLSLMQKTLNCLSTVGDTKNMPIDY